MKLRKSHKKKNHRKFILSKKRSLSKKKNLKKRKFAMKLVKIMTVKSVKYLAIDTKKLLTTLLNLNQVLVYLNPKM